MRHKHLKKLFSLGCVVMLMFCASASAAEAFSAKGVVAEPARITLAAPVGGQIAALDWRRGDIVYAEDISFTVTPIQVLAADSGVIRGLHAQVGDQAANIIAVYTALCHIERNHLWQVDASSGSAYDNTDNRDVRIGDVLRIRQGSGSNEVAGTGEVIRLLPHGFVVELPVDPFDLDARVKFYRGDSKTFRSEDQVGDGKIARPPAIPVLGDGCIAAIHVEEGQSVERGQPLFTLDAATATHTQPPETEILFDVPGVVAEVLVQPGEFVVQGQAVLSFIPLSVNEIAFDVDELDIANVALGQQVRITLDAYAEKERTGTVCKINPIGNVVQDITRFTVLVEVDDTTGLMSGMHAKGFFGE